jgi:hypothetical protein
LQQETATPLIFMNKKKDKKKILRPQEYEQLLVERRKAIREAVDTFNEGFLNRYYSRKGIKESLKGY